MNPYTIEVSRRLTGVRRADREAALADLEELLASGVTPAELGSPREYAAGLRDGFDRPRLRLPGGLIIDRATRRWLLAVVAVSGALAAWGAQAPAVQDEDAVARPAIATSATALCLALMLTTHAGARRPDARRPWLAPVAVLTPILAELAATVLPVRAGLSHVAQRSAQ